MQHTRRRATRPQQQQSRAHAEWSAQSRRPGSARNDTRRAASGKNWLGLFFFSSLPWRPHSQLFLVRSSVRSPASSCVLLPAITLPRIGQPACLVALFGALFSKSPSPSIIIIIVIIAVVVVAVVLHYCTCYNYSYYYHYYYQYHHHRYHQRPLLSSESRGFIMLIMFSGVYLNNADV